MIDAGSVPAQTRLRVRMLLTSGLISIGTVPVAAAAQSYLDNLNTTNTRIDPGTGSWGANSVIWSDANGANHTALADGGVGVLLPPLTRNARLTLIGIVRPGELYFRGRGYALSGGQLGARGRDLTLGVDSGVSVGISSALAGNVTLRGGGVLRLSGDGSKLSGLTIRAESTLDSIGTTAGAITNAGSLTLGGNHAGSLTNRAGASVVLKDVSVSGAVSNAGSLRGTGALRSFTNAAGAVADLGGTVAGSVVNNGALSTRGDLTARSLTNNQGATLDVGRRETLTLGTSLRNFGAITMAGTLAGNLNNESGGRVAVSGSIRGSVRNAADATLRLTRGSITGLVRNSGRVEGTGTIGSLLNASGASAVLGGTVEQSVVNDGDLRVTGALTVNDMANRASGALIVARPDTLKVTTSLRNSGVVTVAGTLDANVVNNRGGAVGISGALAGTLQNDVGGRVVLNDGWLRGTVLNSGQLTGSGLIGSLTNGESGVATLSGEITNRLNNNGTLSVGTGLTIGRGQNNGTLTIQEDRSLSTRGRLENRQLLNVAGEFAGDLTNTGTTALSGQIRGDVENTGAIIVTGQAARIAGSVVNSGLMSLRDEKAGDRLTISSDDLRNPETLSGNGVYALDVNTTNITSDKISLRNTALKGEVKLALRYLSGQGGAQRLGTTTLIDVDETLGARNNFTYSVTADAAQNQQFVYTVTRVGSGDVVFNVAVNNAYGALAGNVALTQSLIGSVINRPASPYVVNLAYEDRERPCGAGGWGRGVGGWAQTSGGTFNGEGKVNSSISANYYGLQMGGDLACFGGAFAGWKGAIGVIAGVNRGTGEQPVFAVDPNDANRLLPGMISLNKSSFDQLYGGAYVAVSKGSFQGDLQIRGERTDFTISNHATVTGGSLGFDTVHFSSSGVTLSGSMSYAVPVGETGWNIVPSAGFAWSRLSTDPLRFENSYRLDFDHVQRKVVFGGGTVSRTTVYGEKNAALNIFATGTYYKDLSDPMTLTFWNEADSEFSQQKLVSDNLGSYGEISVGANYVRILSPGQKGGARQLSTSVRVDKRFGGSLNSVGVTGQLRLQF